MKASRLTLIFLVMAMLTGILAGSSLVMAEETVSESFYKDIRVDANNTTTESSSSSLESMVEGLFNRIFGVFGDIIDFFVMVITAPFRAWANIWGGWGSSFSEWWGPLLGTLVVVGVILLIRFYMRIDRALTKR